jgi:hypothetical protein
VLLYGLEVEAAAGDGVTWVGGRGARHSKSKGKYRSCLFRDIPVMGETGSSVSAVSDHGLDGRGSIPDRPDLGPTQPPVQWVPGVKRARGVMLTTHPLLVPRVTKSRSCTSCHPDAPLWSVTGPLYLFTSLFL